MYLENFADHIDNTANTNREKDYKQKRKLIFNFLNKGKM